MNKALLALPFAFFSAVSIGFAKDPDMICLLPMVVAPQAPAAPVVLVATTNEASSTSTFSQLAADLESYDQEQGTTELTATSPDEDAQTVQTDMADADMASLYAHAVKAQRAAHLKSVRLAKAAALRPGYMVAANEAYDAAHPVSTEVPASNPIAQVAANLNGDQSAIRSNDFAISAVMDAPTGDNLVATPEPSSTALLAAGAGLMLFFIRRRASRPAPVPVKPVVR
jgi:hypothetical protein